MIIMRPAATDDLLPLLELTRLTGFGLTTLPTDRELLRKRIAKSTRSFSNIPDQPGDENYLLVMEDTKRKQVVGTAGIIAKVGGFEPFYAYRIVPTVHESTFLKVRKEIRTLHLVSEHNGPSEVCSLFLAPDARGGQNGRLLSLSRFMFMAENPRAFEANVIAEMRGIIDDQGRSPFWDAIGKHFFEIDFPTADYLSLVNRRFIADLMPRHPIYTTLLPPEAQAVIGQVHQQSVPALKLLESEGFRFTGMLDIFEGGPIVSCPLEQVRTIRGSRRATVVDVSHEPLATEICVMAAGSMDFRACRGEVEIVASGVRISAECAKALRLGIGDSLRFAPLRAPIPHDLQEAPGSDETPNANDPMIADRS